MSSAGCSGSGASDEHQMQALFPQLFSHRLVGIRSSQSSESELESPSNRDTESRIKAWNATRSLEFQSDIVHIPSINVSEKYLKRISGVQFYEERSLYHILHLNNPSNRVIMVTSIPVSSIIIDYYLSLISGSSEESARKRLFLLSCHDYSAKCLSQKILERPRIIKKMRNLVDPQKTVLSTYMSTELEHQIAKALDISEMSSCESISFWGSKIGSRIAFRETQVPHCAGCHRNLSSIQEVVDAINELLVEKSEIRAVMIKLNEGASGLGNALLEIPADSDYDILSLIQTQLQPSPQISIAEFLENIPRVGAIVEEYVEKKNICSPSVQGFISDDGQVSVLSTHEQLLDHQIYQGCSFPCDERYRKQLHQYCLVVGKYLASKGVTHSFGIDFIAWEEGNKMNLSAIEINIRMLGTTHPLMTAALISRGYFDEKDGLLRDYQGRIRSYVACDVVTHPNFKGLTPDDLLSDIVPQNSILQFDKKQCKGCLFYLIDCLSSFGKIGMMFIDESVQEATKGFHLAKNQLIDVALST